MNNWIPLSEVDFTDKSINQYHVDTRDFHVLCNTEKREHKDIQKLKSLAIKMLHDPQTVKDVIVRWKYESGGERTWRFFMTKGFNSWDLKYIRIYRYEDKLIVCDKNDKALSLQFLQKEGTST